MGTISLGINGSSETTKYVAVFAANGTISNAALGTATVNFAAGSGQLFIFASPIDNDPTGGMSGQFSATNPSTWGISGTPLATFDVAAPLNIAPGSPFSNPNFFAVGDVNNFTTNDGPQQQAQGRVLFSDKNDPFFTVTDGALPGFTKTGEGVYANIAETLSALVNGGLDTTTDVLDDKLVAGGNGIPDSLDYLNFVAALAGLSDLGVATGNQAFATGFGSTGAPGSFNYGGGQNLGTGDLAFTLGGAIIPGIFASPDVQVPEPASMLVWGVGMGIAGVMGLRRRRNKAKA
jgi:hypothetical protein